MNFSFIDIVVFTMTGIRILERTFFHVYKWQLKEYRWDRYRAFLRSREGAWLLLHPWYWLGVGLYSMTGFYRIDRSIFFLDSLAYAMAFYPIFSGVLSFVRIFRRNIRYPKPTGRASAITVLALFSLLVPVILSYIYNQFLFNNYSPAFSILLRSLYWLLYYAPIGALVATPLIVTFFVYCTSFPANYFKRRTIEKAKTKMASLPNLKVIGITGSYGKSSTKEFLATILFTKYKVCKTPANRNSEIGVAQTVLRDLKPEHEIFIVEMGAYRRGEIKAICDIVQPTIGVLTAINEQHLALFGSLEETKKAKYELIEALPENGLAVFNLDNSATRSLADETLKPKRTYSTERPADVRASAITVQSEKLSFITEIVSLESRDTISPYRIEANLLGSFHVSNLLAAITVAQSLGMTSQEISEAVKNIAPLNHTMALHHHPSGALIIDDSYSANPDGVLGALAHLKTIPRQYKVLVMMPMIELGGTDKDAHRRVGEHMRHSCDLVIMTQKNFGRIIRKASGLSHQKLLFLSSPKAILNTLQPYLNQNSVILLENRIPLLIIKTLTDNTQKI